TGGLPVQYVLLAAADAPAATDETTVGAGETVVTPAAVSWLGLCFQDRICRDPRAWARALDAAAQDAGASRSVGWDDFVADLSATSGQRLRLRDHVGRPLAVGTFHVDGGPGPPQTVTLTPADDGDSGVTISTGGGGISI